jgi:SAM-dependent methyltransferase
MDPTQRFTVRVGDYAKYRPSYPPEVIDLLKEACALRLGTPVADIGAGTGIFSRQLLEAEANVIAVEPNDAMRAVAEAALDAYPWFTSVAGRAEATTLPDQSIAIVTCAQAFHWFANPATIAEFRRILRHGGWMLLVWNHRQADASPFEAAYEDLLEAYDTCRHVRPDSEAEIAKLIAPSALAKRVFHHAQTLGREALIGLALSSSYAPVAETEEGRGFVQSLGELFDRHQKDGAVVWHYDTDCYFARLT